MKLLFPILFLAFYFNGWAQTNLEFPVDDINTLIQNGTCVVTHSPFDIGSIHDVFDGDIHTLARSANINPLVITLSFPFKVNFSSSQIIHQGGEGWWSMEVADTEADLDNQAGSYVSLFSMSPVIDGVMTPSTFTPQSKKWIRMTVRRTTGDDYVHLTEWQLNEAKAEVEIVTICQRPSQVWLLPGTSIDVFIDGLDAQGLRFPITTDVTWSVDNPELISISQENGHVRVIASNELGGTPLLAEWKDLQQLIPIKVANDFKPKSSPTKEVSVALVLIDPPIEAENGLRFHERFGWTDPLDLTYALRDSLNAASGGVVDYRIVSTYDETVLYAALEGTYISVDSMYRLFLEPGWATFHHLEQTNGYQFDYNGLLNAHDFCTLSNNKVIDEVWVYSMPFTGMYESRLTGDGAFWYNSPPLDGNTCVDQLPVMGFNYERGVAEAMHSFGHRVESAMVHTFGRWDYNAVEKNDWEIFSSYDQVTPGQAYCGNIHFPPNGTSDYDYSNKSAVTLKADNWYRYPFLFDAQATDDCAAWGCTHLGYMSWWFRHLPHFTCKNKKGILTNWWPYIVDYKEGKALETTSSDCECVYADPVTQVNESAGMASLSFFPNPGNGLFFADISRMNPHPARIEMYNSTGAHIATDTLDGLSKMIIVDLHSFPSGVYFAFLYDVHGSPIVLQPIRLTKM